MKPLLPTLAAALLLLQGPPSSAVSRGEEMRAPAPPATAAATDPARAENPAVMPAANGSETPSAAPGGASADNSPNAGAAAPNPAGENEATESTKGTEPQDAAPAPDRAGETSEPPTVAWDAESMTLSAQANGVPFEQFVEALVAAGVGVKPHPTWERARISASFEALPAGEAGRALFGRTFVLTWTHAASEALPRPRFLLMPRAEETQAEQTAPAEAKEPAPDPDTLRVLAQSDAAEAFRAAAEAALRYGDHLLREETLALLAAREQLAIGRELLYRIARADASSNVRSQALGLLVNHGFNTLSYDAIVNTGTVEQPVLSSTLEGGDEALAVVNEAAQSPDPIVSDAGQAALDLVAQRARFFSQLTQEQRNWLFKEDVVGPLSEQLARFRD